MEGWRGRRGSREKNREGGRKGEREKRKGGREVEREEKVREKERDGGRRKMENKPCMCVETEIYHYS